MFPQRLSLITIGVQNLELMKDFYTNTLGWEIMNEQGDIVFYKLNGFILSLYPSAELANDIGIENNGGPFKQITLAILLTSEKAVDQLFEDLRKKKVKIVKPPQKAFWGGYSGYIADPENNYWEIAFNPFIRMDDSGNVIA